MKAKLIVAALLLAFTVTAGAADPPITTQIVDAFNKSFGVHAGFRANHAKGVVVEGHFSAAPGAAALTRSPIYAGGAPIPVTVRFSDAGGLPDVADGSPGANPHGLRPGRVLTTSLVRVNDVSSSSRAPARANGSRRHL